jgi:hypothetical protein
MRSSQQKMRAILVVGIALVIMGAGIYSITSPQINNYTIGAGGHSEGGGFKVSGSFGQHDADGTISGGEFKLSGGFWGAGGIETNTVYIPLVIK